MTVFEWLDCFGAGECKCFVEFRLVCLSMLVARGDGGRGVISLNYSAFGSGSGGARRYLHENATVFLMVYTG